MCYIQWWANTSFSLTELMFQWWKRHSKNEHTNDNCVRWEEEERSSQLAGADLVLEPNTVGIELRHSSCKVVLVRLT